MNNITMTGRLTATPELKTTQSGIAVCSFTLAVKRPRTKDETDFIPCNAWRQSAEFLCNYGTKGSMVGVTGSLTSRKWQDKDGNNRISWEIQNAHAEFCGGKSDNSTPVAPVSDFAVIDTDDSSLPF